MPASSTQTKPIQHSTGIEKTGILQNPDTFTASSGVGSGPSLQKTHNKSDAISEERKGQTGVSANKAVPAVARRDKDKNYILVYSDKDLSPEEKMASLQKYDLSF